MASVTDGWTNIDYNMVSGEIREFTLRGVLMFDRDTGFESPGWREKLTEFVKETRLDRKTALGYRAFVYWMREEGLIETEDEDNEQIR